MQEIRYHPLVDANSEGIEKVPLFFTTGTERLPKMYLSEMIPGYFRLHSKNPVSQNESNAFQIHCPQCGKVLKQIARNNSKTKLGLYTCNGCK